MITLKTVRKATHRSSNGFTLLEVMVALTLSITLLSAVYSALELHYRYSTAGQLEMERSQLARTLLSMMASDIQSVLYSPVDEQEGVETSADSTSDTSDDTSTDMSTDTESGESMDAATEFVDPTESFMSQESGVYGDATSLVLHISKPSRVQHEFLQSEDTQATVAPGDWKSVSYYLAGGDGGGLEELAAEVAAVSGTEQSTEGGLARMEGDQLSMNLAGEQGDLQAMAAQTRILAPEVSYLEFQYFDGLEWTDEWDTSEYGMLPKAIKIIIQFHPPVEAKNPMFATSVSSSTDRFERVVALPLADPLTSEEL